MDLLTFSPIQDIWVDGTDHVEIIGNVFRMVYFKWMIVGGVWRKAAADVAIVRPIDDATMAGVPIKNWLVPIHQTKERGGH